MDCTTYANCVARLLNNRPGVFYLTPDNRADLFRELLEEFEDAASYEIALEHAHEIELRWEDGTWVTYTRFNGE